MNITRSYYSAFHIINVGLKSVTKFFHNTASYNNEYTCMQWIFRVPCIHVLLTMNIFLMGKFYKTIFLQNSVLTNVSKTVVLNNKQKYFAFL